MTESKNTRYKNAIEFSNKDSVRSNLKPSNNPDDDEYKFNNAVGNK